MADWIEFIRSKVGNELIFVPSAGGWIEDEQGRVLLQKRAMTDEIWGFPGGIMELGESAEETAIREIAEETGLQVAVTDLIGIYTKYQVVLGNGDRCQTITFFFKARVTGGSLRIDMNETFDLRFFTIDEAPPLHYRQHRDMWVDAISRKYPVFR
jgi:ADP-ribose pyrophosphatase YjhB (NUDIX family)